MPSRYKLREIRRHGEAASVNLKAVAAERMHAKRINAEYNPEDVLNLDETSFLPKAPLDRGLASKHMSGRNKEKFRITMVVACNATETEKLPLSFIGKSKRPRCFVKKSGAQHDLIYTNTEKAWMT